jgi:hypothetical protein
MNLRDAKAQVEREHPELTGTAKIEAIKALRDQDKTAQPAKDNGDSKPATVGEAWAALAAVAIGMRLIAWGVWGSLDAGPHWYDALYVVLLLTAVAGLVGAYRRR